MTLLQLWFSYRGQLRLFDFVVKGFAPGILLGTVALLLDDTLNARGSLFYSFVAFSLWPASALLKKVVAATVAKDV
jgi:hypothetical protein